MLFESEICLQKALIESALMAQKRAHRLLPGMYGTARLDIH